MSAKMSDYQGAKRSRGGTTASIRNVERRSFWRSPYLPVRGSFEGWYPPSLSAAGKWCLSPA